MLFIAIFILKIQRSIYDVASKGMGASLEMALLPKLLKSIVQQVWPICQCHMIEFGI